MNKKILSFFAALAIFTMFAVPVLTLAQDNAPTSCKITKTEVADMTNAAKEKICPAVDVDCPFEYKDTDPDNLKSCAICCLFNSIYVVVDWIFAILMVVVALMIILGAVTFVTSAGDPNKTGTAKNYILWAVIGLIVALFARAIPPLVKLVIGVNNG
ncbi:MAG: pilin [Candidatus Paceibacterota bacterium]